MSTRATYQFTGDNYKVTTYIHCDGYPEGAATYFWNMHHAQNSRGGWATQFIRANDTAEITSSHEGHGDTEYQYTLNEDGQFKAVKILRDWENETHTKEVIFSGHYAEFINQYGEKQCGGFEPLQQVQLSQYMENKVWITPTQLIAMLETEIKELESYSKRFPQFSGNIDSMRSRVAWLQKTVNEFFKEKV